MPSQLSVALIGYGAWGRNIARNLARLGSLDVICDWKPDALDDAHRRYPDAELQTSIDAVMANPHITACAIATSPASHYEIARVALEADKDVFVEKLGFRGEVRLRKGLEELITWRRMAIDR